MDISVCVITYNHAQYVEQALESITSQNTSYSYEIVVGDDCSTDGTLQILERIAKANHCVRVIRRDTNIGAQRNFVDTIAKCSGRHLFYLDGDDYWSSNQKLQRQSTLLDEFPDVAICFHRIRAISSDTAEELFLLPPEDVGPRPPTDLLCGDTNPFQLASAAIRRSALPLQLPDWFFKLRLGDWPLCLLAARAGGLAYISEVMSHYRVHTNGHWSRLTPSLRIAYCVQMLLHVADEMAPHQRDVVLASAARMTDWWTRHLHHGPSEREVAVRNARSLDDTQAEDYLLRALNAAHPPRL